MRSYKDIWPCIESFVMFTNWFGGVLRYQGEEFCVGENVEFLELDDSFSSYSVDLFRTMVKEFLEFWTIHEKHIGVLSSYSCTPVPCSFGHQHIQSKIIYRFNLLIKLPVLIWKQLNFSFFQYIQPFTNLPFVEDHLPRWSYVWLQQIQEPC